MHIGTVHIYTIIILHHMGGISHQPEYSCTHMHLESVSSYLTEKKKTRTVYSTELNTIDLASCGIVCTEMALISLANIGT